MVVWAAAAAAPSAFTLCPFSLSQTHAKPKQPQKNKQLVVKTSRNDSTPVVYNGARACVCVCTVCAVFCLLLSLPHSPKHLPTKHPTTQTNNKDDGSYEDVRANVTVAARVEANAASASASGATEKWVMPRSDA